MSKPLRRASCAACAAALLWGAAWLAATMLIVREGHERADAIVVLSGASTYIERTRFAAQAYHSGRAKLIVLTNDTQRSGYSAADDRNLTFAELSQRELQRQGVPAASIEIAPEPVSSTYEEAGAVLRYCSDRRLLSILIVTSAYQSRRARWVFKRATGASGIAVGIEPVPPGHQAPGPATWWLHGLGWRMVPGEYLKMVYYCVRY